MPPSNASSSHAPFGRFTSSNASRKWTVNGSIGWLVMEIVSPLAFVSALVSHRAGLAVPFPLSVSSIAVLSTAHASLVSLPLARKVLAALFVLHYVNRSIVSTLENPSRAPMHVAVPLSAVVFNLLNGTLMGLAIAGGRSLRTRGDSDRVTALGLRDGSTTYAILFVVGLAMWTVGFVSNIYHDRILYRLKSSKLDSDANRPKAASASTSTRDPRERYSIPRGGLYAYVSHPAYSSEWFEWLGYLVCFLALAPDPFSSSSSSPARASAFVAVVEPLTEWYLAPPALFLWQEIALMLPRARSGHRWYKRVFGKEWDDEGPRWVVVPGLY
ncbi:hypothetical protein JCM10212_001639 [Sporobolomyces blumeae]